MLTADQTTMPEQNKKNRAVEKYNLEDADDIWGSLSDDSSDVDDDMFGLDDHLNDDYTEDALEDGPVYDDIRDLMGLDDSTDADYTDDEPEIEQQFDHEEEAPEYDDLLQEEPPLEDTEESTQQLDTKKAQAETEPVPADEPETEQIITGETAQSIPVNDTFTGTIDHLGGLQQKVTGAKLFEPHENTLLLIDEETKDEQIIFFEQLTCIRLSHLPPSLSARKEESLTKEIITTVDGKEYQEFVHSVQDLPNLLFCCSEGEQTDFPITLIPTSNIKKRTLNKPLGEILLEKRFISRTIFKKALQEFKQIKSMTIEKIIAQKARIPVAKIEEALEEAKQNQMLGLQTGEILLISGLVREEIILAALEHLEKINKLKIGQFLIEKGIVKEREVYISLAEKHKIPFIDLLGRKFSKKSLESLPKIMVLNHEILPIAMKDNTLIVATYYIDTSHLNEAIAQTAECQHVKYVLSPPSHIRKIISLLYQKK